jgi:hypothetical protein
VLEVINEFGGSDKIIFDGGENEWRDRRLT